MKYNQNIDSKMTISKSSTIIAITLVFFFVIFRLLLPYGDEPDFSFRVEDIVFSEILYSHYYFFANILNSYTWINVSYENTEQKMLRVFITLVAVSPIVLSIIFKKQTINFLYLLNKKNSKLELDLKIKALSLSLLVPGMIYHLGVFAEEQFTLVLSLLFFLFWRNNLILLFLLVMIMNIDFGNSVVILFFLIFFKFFEYLNKKYSIKFILIIFLVLLLTSYFIGINLILLLSYIPYIGDKAVVIHEAYSTYYAYVAVKYPLILRPFMTFMTFVFLTPTKVGAYVLYPIYGFFLLVAFKSFFKKRFLHENREYFIYFITPLAFIITIVFILPGYSQAKYCIFMMPFILYGLLKIFKFKSILLFVIFSNLVVVVSLLWSIL